MKKLGSWRHKDLRDGRQSTIRVGKMGGPQKINDDSALLRDRDDTEVSNFAYFLDFLGSFTEYIFLKFWQAADTDVNKDDPLAQRLSKEQLELISRCEVI